MIGDEVVATGKITSLDPEKGRAVLAMQASCDIVPVCITHDAQVRAIEGAVRAAESGEVHYKAMDDSLARIKRMKERYLHPYRDPDPRRAREMAGRPEFVALAEEISERGGEPIRFPWNSD